MSRIPHLYGATYGIVVNEKNQILMLQRQNTGYHDGEYCLPAGHIEQGEFAFASIQHELEEEIGIKIISADAKLFHVVHKMNSQPREYFELCYVVKKWTGEVSNNEPDKSIGLNRFSLDALPEQMGPEHRHFVESYIENGDKQIVFTEMDLRTSSSET